MKTIQLTNEEMENLKVERELMSIRGCCMWHKVYMNYLISKNRFAKLKESKK